MSGVLNHNRIVFLWLNGFELSPQTLVAKCPNHFQITGKRHSLDLRELAYTKSMKGNNFKKTMRRLVIVICMYVGVVVFTGLCNRSFLSKRPNILLWQYIGLFVIYGRTHGRFNLFQHSLTCSIAYHKVM